MRIKTIFDVCVYANEPTKRHSSPSTVWVSGRTKFWLNAWQMACVYFMSRLIEKKSAKNDGNNTRTHNHAWCHRHRVHSAYHQSRLLYLLLIMLMCTWFHPLKLCLNNLWVFTWCVRWLRLQFINSVVYRYCSLGNRASSILRFYRTEKYIIAPTTIYAQMKIDVLANTTWAIFPPSSLSICENLKPFTRDKLNRKFLPEWK